jgi:ankyrin repeat protein
MDFNKFYKNKNSSDKFFSATTSGLFALLKKSHDGFKLEYLDEIKKYLDMHPEEINIVDNKKWTALMIVSRYGDKEIAQILLEHRSDPNLQNNSGKSALTIAVKYKHFEIIELLLNYGANPNIKDYYNEHPILISLVYGKYGNPIKYNAVKLIELIKLLLQYGANLNIQDAHGWTLLMRICRYQEIRSYKVIKFLLENGADMYLENDHGYTAFDKLFLDRDKNSKKIKVMNLFWEKGYDLNNVDDNNMTILMQCIYFNDFDSIKFLLDRGASTKIRGPRGESVLKYARTTYKDNSLKCIIKLLRKNRFSQLKTKNEQLLQKNILLKEMLNAYSEGKYILEFMDHSLYSFQS